MTTISATSPDRNVIVIDFNAPSESYSCAISFKCHCCNQDSYSAEGRQGKHEWICSDCITAELMEVSQ